MRTANRHPGVQPHPTKCTVRGAVHRTVALLKRRHRLLGGPRLNLLTLCLAASAAFHAWGAAPDLVAQWESFVSHPPVIKELVFEKILPGVPPSAKVRLLYLVRWQTNAFYFQQLYSMTNLSDTKVTSAPAACGAYGNTFWAYTDDRGLEVYPRSANPHVDEKTNSVMATYAADLDEASWVLNLGAPNQDIGSIRWHHDAFARTNRFGIAWTGRLVQGSDGRVSELLLQGTVTGAVPATYTYRTAYEYGGQAGLPDLLPPTLKHFEVHGSNSTPAETYRILSLVTNAAPLPSSDFLYASRRFANQQTILYTNDIPMIWVKDRFMAMTFRPARPAKTHGLIIVWALAAVLVPLVFLLIRRALAKGRGA